MKAHLIWVLQIQVDPLPRHERSSALQGKRNKQTNQATNVGMQRMGSRDGAVVRALASHQCGLGLIPGPRVMWVQFVVSSRPCLRGFSLHSPVYLPPQKPTFANSILIWNQWLNGHFAELILQIPILFYFIYNAFWLCS